MKLNSILFFNNYIFLSILGYSLEFGITNVSFSNFDVSFDLCLLLGVSRKHFGTLALKSNGFLNGLNQEMCLISHIFPGLNHLKNICKHMHMQAFFLNNF